MDKKTYELGVEIRTATLGKEYVEKSLKAADDFTRPFQELVTEYCWGAIWGREGLPRKTRSMLNLALLCALNRPHELRMHLRRRIQKWCYRPGSPRDIYAGCHLCWRSGGRRCLSGGT